ncbi:uncharacterized protein LOC111326421 [Stylophora pistillata]|uniref:uncharacterized protein LOC111326421 n=1 Tax=Stylophora pistillata TaxID=50429 RepID=UPI000C04911E|nr:uncharacterized protein LOC111326421 [Stylophora pistillata]
MRKTSTTLKVEKSQLGSLSWRHNGKLVDGGDPYYTFVTRSKTELRISYAQPELEGSYKVVLEDSKCGELSEEINVEIIEMILSVNPVADVCVGGKASFEIKKNGDLPGQIFWTFSHRNLPKNEHYKENADKTALDINNALPIHAGKYTVIVVKGGKWMMGSTSFDLIVRDSYLNVLVRNPFLVQFGHNAILKVERSELGTLVWKHSGNLLSGHEPHYTYLNPRKTELEISNAGPSQAGVYKVFLKEGGCEKREEIQVYTGDIKTLPISSHSDICVGEKASFSVEVYNYFNDLDFQIIWRYNMLAEVQENEHFSLKADNKTLDVRNALPSHSGNYTAFAVFMQNGSPVESALSFTSFDLRVRDLYLKAAVRSPLVVQFGNNAILKVQKSVLGTLVWKHNGNQLSGHEPNYAYLNPRKTELEISNAGPKQAGVYEVFLKEGGCEKREEIQVQTGDIKIRPISSHSDICVGENTSFAVEFHNYFDDLDFQVIWKYNMITEVQGKKHFSLKADNTVLNVHNALPSHSGNYTVFAVLMQNGSPVESVLSFTSFDLRVRDLYLKAVVRSPLVVQFGNNAILKVEKSALGTLVWKHDGNLLSGKEPHYAYVNPRKTELEISNAGPKQAGVYKVFLKEGGCEKREEIQVQTGDIKIRPISSHSDICVGEKGSFAVEVHNYFDDLDFKVIWKYNMIAEVQKNEHFSLKADNTTLDVHNALPSHSGNYTVFAVLMQNGSPVKSVLSFASFDLRVRDLYLKVLVRSPLLVQLGKHAILKVEKSVLGTLFWKHNGNLLSGDKPHYAFVNPQKTELEISNAGPKQAGLYEVFLKEGGCEKREEIQVQTGEIKTRPISSHSDICVGEKASFAVEINNNFDALDYQVTWRYNMLAEIRENEHFSLKADNTVLDVHNALPSHSGNYTAFAVLMQNGFPVESVLSFTSFDLRVRDLYLKAVVRSPLVVQFGNNAILKVEKSVLGTLVWKHNGNLLSGHETHYAYRNPLKTELEISNAGPKQAGVYEVFLKEGGCEKRAEIQVQTGLYSFVIWLLNVMIGRLRKHILPNIQPSFIMHADYP